MTFKVLGISFRKIIQEDNWNSAERLAAVRQLLAPFNRLLDFDGI